MPPQSNAAGKRPAISAGLGHSAVATDKGELLVWGASRQFQLGLDYIKEKERRNGKTEADLGEAIDRHSPIIILLLVLTNQRLVTEPAQQIPIRDSTHSAVLLT